MTFMTPKTPEEAQAFLEKNGVKYILAQFVDIHGVAKTKSVPVKHFKDILSDGAGFAGFAVWGLGQEPHDPDFMAVGDLATLTLVPWQQGYARIVCDGKVKGNSYPFDTRYILKQQINRMNQRGWLFKTGLEPEFMLLVRNPDGSIRSADDSDTLEKPCYDYKGLSRSRGFLEELVDSLESVGFDVYQIDHEDANGQFEINFTFSSALTSADRYVFFRMAASEIAHKFGIICSFMPKPMSNRTGTGTHIHMSIWDSQEKDLFNDDSDKNNLGLSELAYQFLGGLLAHAPALTALVAPSVNSYKRLVVGRSLSGATWAPAYISYGDNNRTSMVRVPYGRLELRLSDSSCNPYLATAAVMVAGLDGIERKLDPGPPHNINHYRYTEDALKEMGIGVLPQTLSEALRELKEDSIFAEHLGQEFLQEYMELKEMEWVEYQRHVSDWEVRKYLEFY